jgi:stage V sporulation protein S
VTQALSEFSDTRSGQAVDGKVTIHAGASTPAPGLAGSIAEFCREGTEVRLRSIGAGAANQAIKACAIARTMLIGERPDHELVVLPMFETLLIKGESRSAISFVLVYVPASALER